MDFLFGVVNSVNTLLWSYILIAMLIVLGLYFTFRTKFVQFRYFGEMFRLLADGSGKEAKSNGKVSSFQAFCISTSSRVGTGNIAGIALAIVNGGPGAIFWMWLIAIIGSASSFVESTLSQIYKKKNDNGYVGGPAYYMEQGLNSKGMALTFAVLITICFAFVFNAVQANTIAAAFNNVFGMNKLFVGLTLAALTGFIIFGGVHRIAKFSEIIVPVFAGLYIILALFIIVTNIPMLPDVFKLIFETAFGIREVTMGSIGGMMLLGIKRGLFSNEAGMGSAPNAAATAEVSHPVKQGLIQSLGVFTDTILICSCTAFIILLFPTYEATGLEGIELTQAALTHHVGPLGGIFLSICIFLFAFSSVIGNYYYGESNMEFFKLNKTSMIIFRLMVVGMVIFGALTKVQIVWDLADLFMGLMAILNLVAIARLGKYAFIALDDYSAQKKAGIKDPVFDATTIEGLENVECWRDNDTQVQVQTDMVFNFRSSHDEE